MYSEKERDCNQMSLDIVSSFSGSSQNMSQAFVGEFGHGEAISLSSLSTGSLCSISHQLYQTVLAKCVSIPIQLAASMWEICIYRRRGGGWDPSIGGREALSFGRLPQKVETRSQRKVLDVIQSNNPSWLAHEVVSMENSLLYLKNIPKIAWCRQLTETRCQWVCGPVLISFIGARP